MNVENYARRICGNFFYGYDTFILDSVTAEYVRYAYRIPCMDWIHPPDYDQYSNMVR